jgi:hypothetical protein
MLDTNDLALQAIMQASKFENRLERMARSIRIQWPILELEIIDKFKKRQKTLELKQWSQLRQKEEEFALSPTIDSETAGSTTQPC